MESPFFSKSEHNADVTIDGDSSTNDEHVVDITINGNSSSIDEQTPHEAESVQSSDPSLHANYGCIIVEFVVTLVQIVAAIVVLSLTKDEPHPQKNLVTLIIGYTCGCILTLPLLCCHSSDNARLESRFDKKMDNLKTMFDYFFVGWVVVLFWHLFDNRSSLNYTTQSFRLCLAFFAISCIRHVRPHLKFAGLCFLLPMIARFYQAWDFMDYIDDTITTISCVIAAAILFIYCILLCICK